MHRESDNEPWAATRVHRMLVVVLAALAMTLGGCTAAGSEAQTRDVLRAFADNASTRVNIVADRLARQADTLEERAALNREKINVASMGIDNAMNPHAMTGLLDMTFQFDLKARSAEQRVQRLKGAATQPVRPSPMDRFAEPLLAAHAQNRDAVWDLTAKKLKPDQLRGLRAMIDEWCAKNPDLSRSSVQITELEEFAGNDPSRALVFSLVNLQDTNEQVDRIVWGAQRLYDNSHWQFRRILYDALQELERPRDQAIAAVAKAVREERERAAADAKEIVSQTGRWIVGAALLVCASLVAAALLLRGRLRARPASVEAVRRMDVIARVEAIERGLAAIRHDVPAPSAADAPRPASSARAASGR